MPIRGIRRYAELVTAGGGNEDDRLGLFESRRDHVLAQTAELQDSLERINHKIDVYRGRLAAGDADPLWAPRRGCPVLPVVPYGERRSADFPSDC
ncbi:hypothetical protein ABT337_04075 [Saccharopolyspora hirsuta]|uniref:hypothetical protein n=1 Tax=Saccharopolyspora hirsuta TaxID=1837 RepID=UPI00333263FC